MTDLFASVGPFLVQGAGALRDTVVIRPVAEQGVLEKITAIASTVLTLTMLTLTIVAVPALLRFRKTYRKVDHLLDQIYGDIQPIAHGARDITDNINFITTTIRNDVDKVNATIDAANERVQKAVAQTENRVKEFNALLAVVQEEAEHLFLSTASTVRGVQRGAEAFRHRDGMDLASEERDERDAADAADDLAIQEEDYGHDSNAQSTAEALPAAPRVRPRAGTRRRA
jgi:uncharacterized protein YoxC